MFSLMPIFMVFAFQFKCLTVCAVVCFDLEGAGAGVHHVPQSEVRLSVPFLVQVDRSRYT